MQSHNSHNRGGPTIKIYSTVRTTVKELVLIMIVMKTVIPKLTTITGQNKSTTITT